MMLTFALSRPDGTVTWTNLVTADGADPSTASWSGAVCCAAGEAAGLEVDPDATIGQTIARLLAGRAALEADRQTDRPTDGTGRE